MPDNSSISQLIADVKEHVLYMQELGVDALETAVRSRKSTVQSPKPVELAKTEIVIPNLRSEISKTKDAEISKPKTSSSSSELVISSLARTASSSHLPAGSFGDMARGAFAAPPIAASVRPRSMSFTANSAKATPLPRPIHC